MIPADLSFHDATIAAIEREEASYVLHVEDVAVDDGEDVVNGTLTLDGVPHTVVGVMPERFRLPAGRPDDL